MDTYDIGKRIIDIIGSIIGIIIFTPLMIVAAIQIKLVSPEGPVLADIPDRVGKDGKLFRMYKFRSMIPNGQQWLDKHPEWKKKYIENNYKLDPDPRHLPGAGIWRKTSIDEMPQFLNVLKGQMSLVGPRAYYPFELNDQLKRYPQTKEDIKKLKTVKPGITGPWQVGGRSKVGFVERAKMDADYAGSRSLMYDLLIILKTPYVAITGQGVA